MGCLLLKPYKKEKEKQNTCDTRTVCFCSLSLFTCAMQQQRTGQFNQQICPPPQKKSNTFETSATSRGQYAAWALHGRSKAKESRAAALYRHPFERTVNVACAENDALALTS